MGIFRKRGQHKPARVFNLKNPFGHATKRDANETPQEDSGPLLGEDAKSSSPGAPPVLHMEHPSSAELEPHGMRYATEVYGLPCSSLVASRPSYLLLCRVACALCSSSAPSSSIWWA